jgi:hypothetical protein
MVGEGGGLAEEFVIGACVAAAGEEGGLGVEVKQGEMGAAIEADIEGGVAAEEFGEEAQGVEEDENAE